jgi:molybdopterin-guanine dinucleotide biosynthesis protein A
MISFEDVTGYVLAGGESRRMGRDKRWIVFEGKMLLDRSLSILEQILTKKPLVVGDNFDSAYYKDYPVLHDVVQKQGPLGGLVAALRHCKTSWALILPVDMPKLNTELIRKLAEVCSDEIDVAALAVDNQIEPLVALYKRQTLSFWQKQLKSQERSVLINLQHLKTKIVNLPKGDPAALNVNSPADLNSD